MAILVAVAGEQSVDIAARVGDVPPCMGWRWAAYLRASPLRPILAVSIAGDLADISATAIARGGLPRGSAAATTAVAGGSLLLTAAVAALVDE